ncbi:MAG: hypothetical protein MJ126_04420 [Lachnospiraceae bacterium]|nr:hypothetical protein [Lachnospiraceae bacterium]
MNINDMMVIVDGVVDKVCYVNEESDFEYRPELKDFYLWMYYCAFSENKPDFEEADEINLEKAFEYFSKEDVLKIKNDIPVVIRETIESAINKKIEYRINEHRDAKNISLTDVALSELINYLRTRLSESNDIVEAVGKDNIKNFITKYTESKDFKPTELVEAMIENKVI